MFVMKSDQTLQCDVLTHCAHLYVLCEWVFCSYTPVGYREVHLPATEIGPKLRETSQIVRPRRMPRIPTSRRPIVTVPNLLTRTNATGFPVSLNGRTASRFEDRLDSRARRFLRMLVLFVDVIVDHEELVQILVESFSRVRRAFFCNLVLLEQNQVVDLVVVEHRLDST